MRLSILDGRGVPGRNGCQNGKRHGRPDLGRAAASVPGSVLPHDLAQSDFVLYLVVAFR